jgi:hypothetical protein
MSIFVQNVFSSPDEGRDYSVIFALRSMFTYAPPHAPSVHSLCNELHATESVTYSPPHAPSVHSLRNELHATKSVMRG